jgi:hypothetical protein
MTRVSKATLVLVAAATILLTVSIVISKARYEHSPKEPSQVVQTGHSHQASLLFGDTKIMASQAIAKYRSLKPLRASDHFHRWRFEALRGAYSLNRDLQVEIDRMLTQSAFRKSFPGSAPLFFRSPYGWEVRASCRSVSCHMCGNWRSPEPFDRNNLRQSLSRRPFGGLATKLRHQSGAVLDAGRLLHLLTRGTAVAKSFWRKLFV